MFFLGEKTQEECDSEYKREWIYFVHLKWVRLGYIIGMELLQETGHSTKELLSSVASQLYLLGCLISYFPCSGICSLFWPPGAQSISLSVRTSQGSAPFLTQIASPGKYKKTRFCLFCLTGFVLLLFGVKIKMQSLVKFIDEKNRSMKNDRFAMNKSPNLTV